MPFDWLFASFVPMANYTLVSIPSAPSFVLVHTTTPFPVHTHTHTHTLTYPISRAVATHRDPLLPASPAARCDLAIKFWAIQSGREYATLRHVLKKEVACLLCPLSLLPSGNTGATTMDTDPTGNCVFQAWTTHLPLH